MHIALHFKVKRDHMFFHTYLVVAGGSSAGFLGAGCIENFVDFFHGIHPLDIKLNINWPISEKIISNNDLKLPNSSEIENFF